MDYNSLFPLVSAMWTSVALLAGGYARTRNRSAWTWFLLTLFFGPIAAFFLVVWEPVPRMPSAPAPTES
ncbi:hypothetical protein ACIQTT_09210 [Microbacterium sp. NPDC090225]|uniref:hypothetical protein n=1 Tax=Microbacterium sp. NPDC090225 TaxID=3364207 RepID=UPI00382B5B1C